MPYVSDAQRRFAHTPTAKAKGFPTAEFDAASKGQKGLPERVGPPKKKSKSRKKRAVKPPTVGGVGGYAGY